MSRTLSAGRCYASKAIERMGLMVIPVSLPGGELIGSQIKRLLPADDAAIGSAYDAMWLQRASA